MSKVTGGPAFSSHGSMGEVTHEGMTLRDYFAAKAMLTFYTPAMVGISDGGDLIDTPEAVAEFSYMLADAMLAERAK